MKTTYLPVKCIVVAIHLTNDLQAALKEIGSGVKLKTEADADFGVKFNFEGWAWGELDGRGIQASTLAKLPGMQLQLEEKGIAAGRITVGTISDMAILVDKWLDRRRDIFDLVKEYSGVEIFDRYYDLRTLSNEQLLSARWEELLAQIIKGTTRFRADVFEAYRSHFPGLFPFFSLDDLGFSDVFYKFPTVKTPFVFCNKDVIEIGYDRNYRKDRKSFRTTSIPEAIGYTRTLMPADIVATNPLNA